MKEKTTEEDCCDSEVSRQRNREQDSSWLLNLDSWFYKMQQESKSIPCGAKGARVEESKKGYTGDALALRGDEGRDKLR